MGHDLRVLQKLAYLAVIFILLPLAILMGFAMSPWLGLFNTLPEIRHGVGVCPLMAAPPRTRDVPPR